jgi:Phage minor capsid protein 2
MGEYTDFTGRPTAKYNKNEAEFVKYLSKEYAKIAKTLQKGLELDMKNPDRHTIRQVELLKQVSFMIKQMDKPMYERIEKYIKESYMDGRAYHMLSVGQATSMSKALDAQSWNRVNKGKVEALVNDTYKDILLATKHTENSIKELVRDSVKKVAQYQSLSNQNYKPQAEQLKKELIGRGLSERIVKEGFVGVVDKRGRRWDVGVYSKMVMKTKVNDAFKEGVMQRGKEEGMDLAVISDHSAEDACSKWEGVVVSMNGLTEGYPTYAEARATNQVFHPNCEHSLHPIRDLDMLHPDDVADAKKKAKELGYKYPDKVQPKKVVKPKANDIPEPVTPVHNESLYELVRNTDSDLFKKIGDKDYDGLHNVIRNAPTRQVQAWAKFEEDMRVIDAKSKKHPHAINVQGIVMDVSKDAKGSTWSAPYQTTVHELSHNMDYLANVRYGTGSKYQPISHTYQDNKFGKSLQAEFDELVKARDKQLKADFKANKDNPDWLYENGFISEMNKVWYKEHPEELSRLKYRKSYAYSSIEKEIRKLPLNERADLSDIIEGASKAKVNGGFGHGAKYWKDRPHGLPCEAFAEMMDSSVANPKQFEAIKRYFPKSIEVFYEILDFITKGGN